MSQHPTPTEFQQELANNLPLGASENPSHLVWAAVSLAGNKFLFLFFFIFLRSFKVLFPETVEGDDPSADRAQKFCY